MKLFFVKKVRSKKFRNRQRICNWEKMRDVYSVIVFNDNGSFDLLVFHKIGTNTFEILHIKQSKRTFTEINWILQYW